MTSFSLDGKIALVIGAGPKVWAGPRSFLPRRPATASTAISSSWTEAGRPGDERIRPVLFHLMGEPQETRSLAVRDEQAVLSPNGSIHGGAGTEAYTFCWAMGGENQDFDDMQGVEIASMR